MHNDTDPRSAFSYIVWSFGLYVSTIAATVIAANAYALLQGEIDLTGVFVSGLAFWLSITTVAAWPPGLLSFFLFALTDARLRYHPLIGAAFFGSLGALLGGFSATTAAYGAVFGLVSVGGTAGALVLYRSIRTKSSKRPLHA